MMNRLIDLAERGMVPDFALRAGIRRLLKKRLRKEDLGSCERNQRKLQELVKQFATGPVAPLPEKANEQHYEVPARLFELTLGRQRKYSCCLFPEGVECLDTAEQLALEESCEHAGIEDGMDILELGCGWGSLTLFLAERFPNAKITAVSNSTSQREHILGRAEEAGLADNLTVLTRDMNDFHIEQQFDRVMSIEMFEHMRNYTELMRRISTWLRPDGKLFVHIFCHRSLTYEFVDRSSDDWMSRYFFSGGVMPGDDLLLRFQKDMSLSHQWTWNGTHYQKTADAWLLNMDRNCDEIMPVLEETYGKDADRWFQRWRMFYLAVSELFGFERGEQWWVSHYLFENNRLANRIQPEAESIIFQS